MAVRMLLAISLLSLAGCVTPVPPVVEPAGDAPVVIEPIEISDGSFITRGTRFARGLVAGVRLCVTPEGTIASATVIESSGEARFDQFAVEWAQRVSVRPRRENGVAVASCGVVRVQINTLPAPGLRGRDNALG